MTDRIRLTISVDPETHAAFTKMAQQSGLSLGRAMGDWLADTAEAAQFVASKLEVAKRAPRAVIEELLVRHQREGDALYSARSALERAASGEAGAERQARPTRAGQPPSSHTGVKTSRKGAQP